MTEKNPVPNAIPLLARHMGRWVGTYRFIKPDLTLLDQYDFDILVELPEGEPGCHYRQTSSYTWPDGRADRLVFEAECIENRIIWDAPRIAGKMWAIDDTTLYLTFYMKHDPSLVVHEMIQLSKCGQNRARTWHWLRDGAVEKLTLVDEKRV